MVSKVAGIAGVVGLCLCSVPAGAIDLAAIKAGQYPRDAKEEAHVCAALFAIAQLMEQADQARPPKAGAGGDDGANAALSPSLRRAEAEAIAEAKAESNKARSAMFASFVEAWGNRAAMLGGENIDTFFDKTLQSDADSLASLKYAFPVSPEQVHAFPDVPRDSWLGRCSASIRAKVDASKR